MSEQPNPAAQVPAAEVPAVQGPVAVAEEPGVVVEVPATSANLGPGFDSLGLALELHHRVVLRRRRARALATSWPPVLERLEVGGEGQQELPTGPDNLVWQAALAAFEAMGPVAAGGGLAPAGGGDGWAVTIVSTSTIPVSSGLGSSAAAVVAGLWGADALFGARLGTSRLLALAARMEGHPDNVAAASLGGFVVSARRGDGVVAVRVPVPRESLLAVVAVPAVRLATADARRLLPSQVALSEAVHGLSGAALVVATLTTGRWELLRVAMEDRLHQPARVAAIPGAAEAMSGALAAGAFGACLSGAGPSVLALCEPGRENAVGSAMAAAFGQRGVRARVLAVPISGEGVRIRREAGAPDGMEAGR